MADPASTGRTGWFDASDTTNLFTTAGNPPTGTAGDGNAVQQWLAEEGDLSLRYNSATNESPLYDADGINSLGAVVFDGSNDVMELREDDGTTTLSLDTLISSSAFDVHIAFRLLAAPSSSGTIYFNDALISDSGGYWGVFLYDNGGTYQVVAYMYDSATRTVAKTITTDTDYVVRVRLSGGTLGIYLDYDTPVTTGVGSVGSVAGDVNVGTNANGTPSYANVRIGEILAYDAALSGADETATVDYMTDKWLTAPGAGLDIPIAMYHYQRMQRQ